MLKAKLSAASLLIGSLLLAGGAAHATPAQYKMTTDIPSNIILPDSVETSIGILEFFDGMPSEETMQKSYDFLDLQRATSVFLDEMRATSMVALRDGLEDVGVTENHQIGIFEELLDSKALYLTPNSESVYAHNFLDLENGPLVVETPGPVLGMFDDMWFRNIADFGLAGLDRGQGGKYLVLPPGYEGEVPEGYHIVASKTYGVWLMLRGFAVDGDPTPTAELIKSELKVYPLNGEAQPMEFINISGIEHNTVHANDYYFFEELNSLIQREHIDAISPEERGKIALLGIEKGKSFNPDERMRKILNEGAVIGAAIARSSTYAPREQGMYVYDDTHTWWNPFAIGNHLFMEEDNWMNADAMSSFHYIATGITPAMAIKMVGVGSQYAAASQDSNGDWLDGGRNYKLTLPADIPAKDFWSVTLYDGQTRSMLQTDQRQPSASSQTGNVKQNADGTTDIYFGPEAPKGWEGNWVQTVPGKSWFGIVRLYGPLESWFDQTWRPGDIELLD